MRKRLPEIALLACHYLSSKAPLPLQDSGRSLFRRVIAADRDLAFSVLLNHVRGRVVQATRFTPRGATAPVPLLDLLVSPTNPLSVRIPHEIPSALLTRLADSTDSQSQSQSQTQTLSQSPSPSLQLQTQTQAQAQTQAQTQTQTQTLSQSPSPSSQAQAQAQSQLRQGQSGNGLSNPWDWQIVAPPSEFSANAHLMFQEIHKCSW